MTPHNRIPLDIDIVAKALEIWRADLETAAQKKLPPPEKKIPPKMIKTEFTVRDLPSEERPRERMVALGAAALSQVELLACLLGRGISGESVLVIAQRLVAIFGSIEAIGAASVEELAKVRGIGTTKAIQLKAACEIGRRANLPKSQPGDVIKTADDAIAAARKHLQGLRKEHFILLLLDTRHRIAKIARVSVGVLDASLVHPRETFLEAIESQAAALIIAHNHPSGDPTPSTEDLELTDRLIECGQILGIPVLDHVIVGSDRSISLKEEGYWPQEEEEDSDEDGEDEGL
jgi:DNA repair protein RadC